jgi:uncharacterized protein YhdP
VVGASPAEAAAAPPAGGAAGAAARGAPAHLRAARLALGGALVLALLLLVAYELAAARVPQHRAALEELIRHQTGLEVRFRSLAVRWGWYGPEAVFEDVELGEPGRAGVLLRAPRLSIGLDLWRMARSGRLEAGRIALESPDIDLAGGTRSGPRATHTPADVRGAGTRILARWRGGEISVSGGTLRTLLPGGSGPVTFGIRHAELRHLAADWSAEAQVVLPPTLGASAHVALQLRSDPRLASIASAALSIKGRRLELAGWGALAGVADAEYLPRSGIGDLELRAAFAHGRLRSATGRIAAEALEWRAPAAAGPALALDTLRGTWQLTQREGDWHLSVDALEIGVPGATPASPPAAPVAFRPASSAVPAPASLTVDAALDGTRVSGEVQHAPLAALAALARWHAPQFPNSVWVVGGEARELIFDWSAQRLPGARLAVTADLQALSLASSSGEYLLSGLSGRVSGVEDSVAIALHSPDARLTLLHGRREPQRAALDGLEINARLNAAITAEGSWQLDAQELQIHRAGLTLNANGALAAAGAGSPPIIDARLLLKDSDIALLASLPGPRGLSALGAAAGALSAGRVEGAELTWRGPLRGPPWSVPGTRFTGSLTLRDASLRASDAWPDSSGISAAVEWHGAHFHAAIERARAGAFALTDAAADWDARAGHAAHFAGRLAGDARELIAWLKSHPQAAAWAPGFESIDLRGATLLDLEVEQPPDSGAAPPARPPRVRVAALLDGVELRPVAGLPPLGALRGTLGFAGGHLQRSTLTGEWLGGPASLTVAERREHGVTVLAISGRGAMGARQVVQAAGADADDTALSGSADWSALLTVVPAAEAPRWELHADSSLAGVASRLPEPFAKAARAELPLHVDLQAGRDAGELRVSLGERLTGVAALSRSGETWRIERGALRLAGATPALPVEPVMLLDGRVSRLDLPSCLALWRQAARDAALPALRAHVTATQLLAGTRDFPDVSVTAEAMGGGGSLRLQSGGLSGSAHWGAVVDAGHPALVHFARFNITQPGDAAFAAALAAVLAPATQLAVDELQWQGRKVGSFAGTLAVRGGTLDASELRLRGASAETYASAHCVESACSLGFSLESADAAAALAAFGFTPDVSANHARFEGQLSWSPQAAAPLATLGGRLHMRLEDGAMGSAGDAPGVPFALLSVPALLAGLSPESTDPRPPALRFSEFSADYEVRDGEAVTPGLHFDGDAEILVRGRVGLSSGDYDQQAWILRGEDRLPAAVRRLGPSPRVAALWLSLRELFGGVAASQARAALRLRGPWSDPIVTPVE